MTPSRGDTVVGNDVWFGYQATVMPGVRIGDGAIIAAGAVVTADVPPYTIIGGNPAKLIRQRFDDTDVGRLHRAAWWDWPVELVTEHARMIMVGTPADGSQCMYTAFRLGGRGRHGGRRFLGPPKLSVPPAGERGGPSCPIS